MPISCIEFFKLQDHYNGLEYIFTCLDMYSANIVLWAKGPLKDEFQYISF